MQRKLVREKNVRVISREREKKEERNLTQVMECQKWEISLIWIEFKMNELNFNNLPYSFANSQDVLACV